MLAPRPLTFLAIAVGGKGVFASILRSYTFQNLLNLILSAERLDADQYSNTRDNGALAELYSASTLKIKYICLRLEMRFGVPNSSANFVKNLINTSDESTRKSTKGRGFTDSV